MGTGRLEDDEDFTHGRPYVQPELLRHSRPELGAAFAPHKRCPGCTRDPQPRCPLLQLGCFGFPRGAEEPVAGEGTGAAWSKAAAVTFAGG